MYLKIVYDGKQIGGVTFDIEEILRNHGGRDCVNEYKSSGMTDWVQDVLNEYFWDSMEFEFCGSQEEAVSGELERNNAVNLLQQWARE